MTDDPQALLEQQKANCIFCKIIKKEVPAMTVYEDNDFIAIMDIRPAIKGHVLVMPKEHYPIMPVIPQNLLPKLFLVSKKIAAGVKEATSSSQVTIFIANGGPAGQQSPHFILHVFPRKSGDNIDTQMPTMPQDSSQTKALTDSLQKAFNSIFPKELNKQVQAQPVEQSFDPLEEIAIGLEQNPEVKQMIIQDPEKFKQILQSNPQLKSVFDKVDIDVLSQKLKEQNLKVIKKEEAKDVEVTEQKVDEKKEEKNQEKQDKKADLDKIGRLFS